MRKSGRPADGQRTVSGRQPSPYADPFPPSHPPISQTICAEYALPLLLLLVYFYPPSLTRGRCGGRVPSAQCSTGAQSGRERIRPLLRPPVRPVRPREACGPDVPAAHASRSFPPAAAEALARPRLPLDAMFSKAVRSASSVSRRGCASTPLLLKGEGSG